MKGAELIELCLRMEEIKNLKQSKSLYEHERDFEAIWIELGRAVFEKSIGAVKNNRRKKK